MGLYTTHEGKQAVLRAENIPLFAYTASLIYQSINRRLGYLYLFVWLSMPCII
jgi:hypothetical protein